MICCLRLAFIFFLSFGPEFLLILGLPQHTEENRDALGVTRFSEGEVSAQHKFVLSEGD